MLNPGKLATARKILGWPTFIAAMGYFIVPPFAGITIPLTLTAIMVPVALSYMFFNLISQSRYLTHDKRHKEPMAVHIAMLAPIMIGLQGAQYSSAGELDGHALVFMLLTLAIAAVAFPISVWVGRKHKPEYEEVRRMRAERALTAALDNVQSMSAATRADIEARAKDASTDDLEKMAKSITSTAENVPELLK
tara:strand:+ start:238535 stop:239113 length:579 start_codon:yes stop_codon:yes gene_type:complete